MIRKIVNVHGKRFVMIPETELRRLEQDARRADRKVRGRSATTLSPGLKPTTDLPPIPPADAQGNRPALEYIRASIGRDIVKERKALGLTQERLAELAGLRQETLSRLESGKHSPTVRTVEKIDRALKQYAKRRKK